MACSTLHQDASCLFVCYAMIRLIRPTLEWVHNNVTGSGVSLTRFYASRLRSLSYYISILIMTKIIQICTQPLNSSVCNFRNGCLHACLIWPNGYAVQIVSIAEIGRYHFTDIKLISKLSQMNSSHKWWRAMTEHTIKCLQ